MRRADVRLFWHPQRDYLAVQVDRFTKTRKSTYTSFELFSVKERDIPMEVRHLLTVHAACEHCRSPCSDINNTGTLEAQQDASKLGLASRYHSCRAPLLHWHMLLGGCCFLRACRPDLKETI